MKYSFEDIRNIPILPDDFSIHRLVSSFKFHIDQYFCSNSNPFPHFEAHSA